MLTLLEAPFSARIAGDLIDAHVPGVDFTPGKETIFHCEIRSPFYMNCRNIQSSPKILQNIIRAYLNAGLYGVGRPFDMVAGVQTAALSYSIPLALQAGLPHLSVKKESKKHGRLGLIDGADPEGKRVLLVEDIVTTGDSAFHAIDAIHAAGGAVTSAVVIMSYDLRGANRKFDLKGVPLTALTTLWDILKAMVKKGVITKEEADRVSGEWYDDYEHWYERRTNPLGELGAGIPLRS